MENKYSRAKLDRSVNLLRETMRVDDWDTAAGHWVYLNSYYIPRGVYVMLGEYDDDNGLIHRTVELLTTSLDKSIRDLPGSIFILHAADRIFCVPRGEYIKDRLNGLRTHQLRWIIPMCEGPKAIEVN